MFRRGRVGLQAGDLLVVEPGEVHTFVDSSDDDLHFVVQAPFVEGDKRIAWSAACGTRLASLAAGTAAGLLS
jgi:hypothetical protein